ncbi:GNAT family N-acetyltransferase [Humidisolicoccus flavus]|uniref:GNAT family N-acetyltransferase n=1 Tax=Humidisolicoccus flavus TaxID=3111414 RepID=UPI003245E807
MQPSARDALWPASGVRIAHGDMELRWIDDELLRELAELATRGIHDDDAMPFEFPWTRGTPGEVARSVMDFQWAARSKVGPERFVLELAVIVDGHPVGIQGISSSHWARLRETETGSWLGREFQGRGFGHRMRSLILHLCFDGLGAEFVTSTAFTDNPASNAVSRRAGYEDDGIQRVVHDGRVRTLNRFRLSAARWAEIRSSRHLGDAPVEMHGLEPVLAAVQESV